MVRTISILSQIDSLGEHEILSTKPGSSNGRGPRCSGWFADYISEQGNQDIQSLTLEGGIKGWVKAGDEYTTHIDGFEPEYWKQFD